MPALSAEGRLTIDHPIDRPDLLTVVLTGGIASGKTAASSHFAELGVPIIDTDVIARELVEPGKPALQHIVQELGPEFLDESGRLARRRLRRAIFNDLALKHQLESILHPLIAAEALRRIQQVKAPYCIIVVPLYAESGRWGWVDRVLVIDVSEAVQIERVMARDEIDREQAERILDAQLSRSARLALADDVIDNSGDMETLRTQVEALHLKYLQIAGAGFATD